MGSHSAPEEKPDPRARKVPGRRPGPKHSDGSTRAPAKKAAKKATPSVSKVPERTTSYGGRSAPTSPARPAPRAPARAGRPRGQAAAAAAGEARRYADRAAFKATTGKPSVTGRAATGAAGGAAAGAAIGSVVPGVGTAVGGAVGAGIGGTTGAVAGAKAKKAYKAALHPATGAKRLIVAEFAICIVIAALSPLTDEKKAEAPAGFMKRMTAIVGLFFILALLSAAGPGPAKAAAGFGGIVTLSLAVSGRSTFVKIAEIFNKPAAGVSGRVGGDAVADAPSGTSGTAPATGD